MVHWLAKARHKVKMERHQASREKIERLIAQGDVVVEVDSEEELAELPWWRQGDRGMYTEENLGKRDQLRSNEAILEATEEVFPFF